MAPHLAGSRAQVVAEPGDDEADAFDRRGHRLQPVELAVVDGGQRILHLARAGQHAEQVADRTHLADRQHLFEEILQGELAGADLGRRLLGLHLGHGRRVGKKVKPVIVSMGDYAASGGYYISCAADSIIAQPNTLTGSIGIFGTIPNIEGLNKKIGLTHDGVKTNKMSDAISLNRAFTPDERNIMQSYINRGYELFTKRCADGRGMNIDSLKAIAEGRVWTGEDAMRIGLVDKLGGLGDAIKIAAGKAKLENYMVKEFPAKEDIMTRLFKDMNSTVETKILKSRLGDENYRLLKQIEQAKYFNGIQALMPVNITLN